MSRSGDQTRRKVLDAAVRSFSAGGYAGASLDEIAAASGIRKQSLLYHFAGKDALFAEAAVYATQTFAAALDAALRSGGQGLDRIDALVAGAHRLARRRPEVLGMIREVSRVGPPVADEVAAALASYIEGAAAWLERAMDEGKVRRQNPRVAVLTIYSAVVGHLTESSVRRAVLSAVGERTTERELVGFLKAALAP